MFYKFKVNDSEIVVDTRTGEWDYVTELCPDKASKAFDMIIRGDILKARQPITGLSLIEN